TIVTRTLTSMAQGGVYDQVGGGFHRYSTDPRWIVPHFEKMLYDNAGLLANYVHAWQLTKDPLYRETAEGILTWVDELLTDRERASETESRARHENDARGRQDDLRLLERDDDRVRPRGSDGIRPGGPSDLRPQVAPPDPDRDVVEGAGHVACVRRWRAESPGTPRGPRVRGGRLARGVPRDRGSGAPPGRG